jgi:hypothetical protein
MTLEGTTMPRHAMALLLALLAFPTLAAADNRWERTFPVTGGPALDLQADDASVHVAAWDRAAVEVRVTTHGWALGAPRGVSVEASQDGDRIRCVVREPHGLLGLSLTMRWTRIEVSLPRQADLDLRTGDGTVTLEPLSGVVSVSSGDGAIEADGLRGRLTLSTGDGRIRARGLDGALDAHSGDGSIEVAGRFDRLAIATSDGRIVATALEGSRMGDGWNLHSGDGSVTLSVPPALGAQVFLHSGDGSVRVDLPLQTTGGMHEHTVQGRLNGGGPLLEIRTGDGSIRLESI